jgi:hypothetical protein
MTGPGTGKAYSCMEAILIVFLSQGSINLGDLVTIWDMFMLLTMEEANILVTVMVAAMVRLLL